MKTTIYILSLLFFLTFSLSTYGQLDVLRKAKQKTEKRIDKKMDKGIDKGLDKIEKDLFGEDKESDKEKKEAGDQSKEEESVDSDTEAPSGPGEDKDVKSSPELKWAKYDFVPGDKVIFEDDQRNEENGEFPSRWDLVKGRVEIAEFDNHNTLLFLDASTQIIPYMKNPEADYLPDEFTVEFDGWYEAHEYTSYRIWFYAESKQKSDAKLYHPVATISANLVQTDKSKGYYPGENYGSNLEESIWRHIAISFNRRALKVYLDDARIVNIPNMEINPTGITLGIDGFGTVGVKGINRIVKNFRIAEGAVKLYDKLIQDGKIITNGIRFDAGKATIRPESMGVINEIADLMKDNSDLNFSIEGHTDSDGDDELNMKLSEDRALAVKTKMTEMGIDESRMKTKGWGESQPLSDNSTPEGKANNRRVEFVKF
jgi:OOP family OmpA-OmpF porin